MIPNVSLFDDAHKTILLTVISASESHEKIYKRHILPRIDVALTAYQKDVYTTGLFCSLG